MTTVTRHAPGTFCWADLATSDREGARAFYTKLFGWETFDDEMMPGEPYVKTPGWDLATSTMSRMDLIGESVRTTQPNV